MLNTKYKAAHKCTALLLSLLMLASMAVLPAGAESNSNADISATVTQVSLGTEHSACITSDGSLYTWGRNNFEQLGDGTTEDKYTPTKIMDNVNSVIGDCKSRKSNVLIKK